MNLHRKNLKYRKFLYIRTQKVHFKKSQNVNTKGTVNHPPTNTKCVIILEHCELLLRPLNKVWKKYIIITYAGLRKKYDCGVQNCSAKLIKLSYFYFSLFDFPVEEM